MAKTKVVHNKKKMSATSETLTAAVCIFENPASGNTAYKERLQIELEKTESE